MGWLWSYPSRALLWAAVSREWRAAFRDAYLRLTPRAPTMDDRPGARVTHLSRPSPCLMPQARACLLCDVGDPEPMPPVGDPNRLCNVQVLEIVRRSSVRPVSLGFLRPPLGGTLTSLSLVR